MIYAAKTASINNLLIIITMDVALSSWFMGLSYVFTSSAVPGRHRDFLFTQQVYKESLSPTLFAARHTAHAHTRLNTCQPICCLGYQLWLSHEVVPPDIFGFRNLAPQCFPKSVISNRVKCRRTTFSITNLMEETSTVQRYKAVFLDSTEIWRNRTFNRTAT
jgi:hypothetical protein